MYLNRREEPLGREEDKHPGRCWVKQGLSGCPGSGTERTRVPGTRGLGGPKQRKVRLESHCFHNLSQHEGSERMFFLVGKQRKGAWDLASTPGSQAGGHGAWGDPGDAGGEDERSGQVRGAARQPGLGAARGAQGGFGQGSRPAPAPPRKGPWGPPGAPHAPEEHRGRPACDLARVTTSLEAGLRVFPPQRPRGAKEGAPLQWATVGVGARSAAGSSVLVLGAASGQPTPTPSHHGCAFTHPGGR